MLLIFFALFVIVVAAHFAFARQAWLGLRSASPTEIDLDYVRRDDWFAQSFRSRIAQWSVAPATQTHTQFRVFEAKGAKLIESEQSRANSRTGTMEIYSFTNDFACFPESVFARELSVKGNAEIGAQSHLQAITAGGHLKLGAAVKVARWVDADGEVTLGPDTAIGARATSRYALRAATGARAKLMSAPIITSDGYAERFFDRASVPARGALQFPLATGGASPALTQMDDNCMLHHGDLHFQLPVEIRTRLIVRGSFSCPSGSLLHHDIKAEGELSVGPESLVLGNLTAGGRLALFDNCQFEGVLHAGADMLLATGVRGRARRHPVAAYATGQLYLETNVAVEGKLAAGGQVQAVKFWRK
jgi:hypothetical protein